MTDSRNWNWVNEIPPAWESPAGLMSPTVRPGDNLVVIMIGSGIIGNDIFELVGEYLLEQSRVAMWVYQQ